MWNKLNDHFFWFLQPSSVLSHADKVFGYSSLGVLIAAIIFRVLASVDKNQVHQKLFLKLWHMACTIGIFGLFWFALRFENTPILAQRYWFGLIIIIGIIWFVYVLKYIIFEFPKEKQEFSRELVKSKYLPKSK